MHNQASDPVEQSDPAEPLGKSVDRRAMLAVLATGAAGILGAFAAPSTALAATGDFVHAGQKATGTGSDPGLWGSSDAIGVDGECTGDVSGVGVRGTYSGQPGGIGVLGRSDEGTGVWAETDMGAALFVRAGADGTAIHVDGRMWFTRSGIKHLTKGKISTLVTVPGGVKTGAMVLATAQSSPGSGVYISYARRYDAKHIRIRFSKTTTLTCDIAWMVLG